MERRIEVEFVQKDEWAEKVTREKITLMMMTSDNRIKYRLLERYKEDFPDSCFQIFYDGVATDVLYCEKCGDTFLAKVKNRRNCIKAHVATKKHKRRGTPGLILGETPQQCLEMRQPAVSEEDIT